MFHEVNWLAVVVAGVAFFILGAVWYTVLFGRSWSRLVGIDPERPGGNVPLIFGATLLLEIVAAAFLAGLLHLTGTETLGGGLHLGALLGFGIVTPVIAINNLFQRRPVALTAIDGGHMTAGLALAGMIVGAWH